MALLRNFFITILGLLSVIGSALAVNAGKTSVTVTCTDSTGGPDGKGKPERIAQEVDSSAVNAILAAVPECQRASVGNRLKCQSTLQASNRAAATAEVRRILNAVRAAERAHLAANQPSGGDDDDCGDGAAGGGGAAAGSTTAVARRNLFSAVGNAASNLIGKVTGKGKPATPAPASKPPTAPAAGAAKPPPKKACKKKGARVKRGPPTVAAALLSRARLANA